MCFLCKNIQLSGLHMWINMKPYSSQATNPKATKYTVGISDKRNLVDQQRNTISLWPGHQIRIKAVPRLFTTSNHFNELSRDQRKCKLPQETDGLSFLKEYTRIGCETECAIQRAISTCKCLPWYYPSDFNGLPMCEMFGGHCFEVMMADERHYRSCKAQCLVDCYETAYIIVWSLSPINLESTCQPSGFNHHHFKKAFPKHFAFQAYKTLVEGGYIPDVRTSFYNGSLCQDYVKNYVSFVSVESPSSRIISTHKDRRIFFYNQLSTFGGTLALFFGMSVISVFEVGFLLFHLAIEVINLVTQPLRKFKDWYKKPCDRQIQSRLEKHIKVK